MKFNLKVTMYPQIKLSLVLAFVSLMTFFSCVQEPEVQEQVNDKITSMSEQIISIEKTLELLTSLGEVLEYDMSDIQNEIEDHLISLKSVTDVTESTVATLKLQRKVASVIGDLQAEGFESQSNALVQSLKSWLGDDFETYVDATVCHSKVKSVTDGMNTRLSEQCAYLDAVISDVEAGLCEGVEAKELSVLSSALKESIIAGEKNLAIALEIVSSLEEEYIIAIEHLSSDSESFDSAAFMTMNDQAQVLVKSVQVSLADMLSRLEALEAQLADIKSRIVRLEGEIEGLLEMIQSVTFLSDYSQDYAIAYYTMGSGKVNNPAKPYDGKCTRTPVETIELNYMIRPASAASAVAKNVTSVVGYYAERIQTRAIDPSDFIDFAIQSVSVTNSERGIITVKLSHNLKDDFYYKEVGAKCALFITAGKTDISSKFVEIIPKDESATVYVEDLKINHDDFEIDQGQKLTLTSSVNPSNATNKTVRWTSSNPDIVSINANTGELTAESVGSAVITVTSNGTDEWGLPLAATCKVKVNPAIRLSGPAYVEVGKTAELSLDFPAAMIVESKTWMVSDKSKATVSDGSITGIADTYNQYTYDYSPITVTCIVNGDITLTHEMKVVVPQPRQVKFNNYPDDSNVIDMRIDQTASLAATILPANVNPSQFRFFYESDAGLGWIDSNSGFIKEPMTPGSRYVYVNVFNVDKHHYFAPGVSLRRTVVVNVKPYYVETMKFSQPTMRLAPGQSSTLKPVFTSDVTGKQPTYTELSWTSSNPGVVSVNASTGEITTLKEGSAVITATTASEWAVPSGQSAKSASCTIIVEKPAAPVNVGDYYYSDGTWSSTRNASKTVIGIVISNVSAATSDPLMSADYPKCTHGLVVGLPEYSSTLGQFGYSTVYNWLQTNGYPNHNTETPNGYGLTKGMTAYRKAYPNYVELYDTGTGPLAKHTVKTPSGASSWYIPSYKEMKLIYENKEAINKALKNAGGTQITGSLYWSSTLRTYNSYNDCQGSPFDMVNGGWYAFDKKTEAYPVRVVFAF